MKLPAKHKELSTSGVPGHRIRRWPVRRRRSGFSDAQLQAIDSAIREAEVLLRFEVSVYVGRNEGERARFAYRLHAALVVPDRSILITIDPASRECVLVLGRSACDRITAQCADEAVRLMCDCFAEGNLAQGIAVGLRALSLPRPQSTSLHRSRDRLGASAVQSPH